jgi:hypothetical protein
MIQQKSLASKCQAFIALNRLAILPASPADARHHRSGGRGGEI